MSDQPDGKKPSNTLAALAIAAASAATGYLAHDPLRAELMTAGLYGREPPAYVAPPPAPPVLLRQELTTARVYGLE